MIGERDINSALKLNISRDRISNQGFEREERHCQGNENVSIDSLILDQRVLSFSRKKTICVRIATEFCHNGKYVVVEIFFRQYEAAGGQCAGIVVLVVHSKIDKADFAE